MFISSLASFLIEIVVMEERQRRALDAASTERRNRD